MAKVTLGGNPCDTCGDLPKIGELAPNFKLRKIDLTYLNKEDLQGKNIVLNIFPSVDTSTCANSVRTFNQRASEFENTQIVCVSRDLPFAQRRFCGAEGIDKVVAASDFATGEFGKAFGVELINGNFEGIHARAIVVIDAKGIVKYTELVPEIGQEPNYDAALKALG